MVQRVKPLGPEGGDDGSGWKRGRARERESSERERERAGDVDAATRPNTVRLQERGNQRAAP